MYMEKLLKQAFEYKLESMNEEELKVEPRYESIDSSGNAFIKFDPPIVAVPNGWETLFDEERIAMMDAAEREKFEEERLKIIHVQFEQNSEELPQRFFLS